MKYYLARKALFTAGLFAFIQLFAISESHAQIRASERSQITQTIDGTEIKIDYSRPSIRGRGTVFGGIVHWGEVWTPGADMATTLETSKDITIDGNPVPAGKYSVWIALREAGDWEVALSEDVNLFHVPHLVLSDEQIRFFVQPRYHASPMETLTFHWPSLKADGGTLRMHWGTTFIDMNVKVPSTQRLTVTEEEATPYTGHYSLTIEANPAFDQPAVDSEFDFSFDGTYLSGMVDMGWPEIVQMGLAPVSEHVFHPVFFMGGEPAGVVDQIHLEFELDSSGMVTGFKARNPNDGIWFQGSRLGPAGTN